MYIIMNSNSLIMINRKFSAKFALVLKHCHGVSKNLRLIIIKVAIASYTCSYHIRVHPLYFRSRVSTLGGGCTSSCTVLKCWS